MSLRPLQKHLSRIYEIDIEHDVDDFLITDPEVARALESADGARDSREKLLVRRTGDELDVALYVDPVVIEHLLEDDPADALHDGNLDDYWVALEGVSHFMYFLWNTHHRRTVSRLELEMQAEVDKYVSAAFLIGRQCAGRVPAELHRQLFSECSFDESLDDDDLELYRSANHYAGRYCEQLASTYLRDRSRNGMIGELRRFYRLTQTGKIRRITTH